MKDIIEFCDVPTTKNRDKAPGTIKIDNLPLTFVREDKITVGRIVNAWFGPDMVAQKYVIIENNPQQKCVLALRFEKAGNPRMDYEVDLSDLDRTLKSFDREYVNCKNIKQILYGNIAEVCEMLNAKVMAQLIDRVIHFSGIEDVFKVASEMGLTDQQFKTKYLKNGKLKTDNPTVVYANSMRKRLEKSEEDLRKAKAALEKLQKNTTTFKDETVKCMNEYKTIGENMEKAMKEMSDQNVELTVINEKLSDRLHSVEEENKSLKKQIEEKKVDRTGGSPMETKEVYRAESPRRVVISSVAADVPQEDFRVSFTTDFHKELQNFLKDVPEALTGAIVEEALRDFMENVKNHQMKVVVEKELFRD